MGKTTFSGPILAGTINETTGSTFGANVENTGFVVNGTKSKMLTLLELHIKYKYCWNIPANSQIVRCYM